MSDYIKREDAIQSIIAHDLAGGDARGWAEYLLENTSTADVAPVRRGHWLYTEAWPHRVYCSVCFRTYALKHWQVWEDGSLARAYCPNCGAKMDGDGE